LTVATPLLGALDSNAGVGNEVGTDPLPTWLTEASATSGILTYKVYNTCGGITPNPKIFIVNPNGKTSLQIAQEIAANFNAPLLPCAILPATVYANEEITKYSAQPAEFNCQFFVRVTGTNNANVPEIAVVGGPGQLVVSEGSALGAGQVSQGSVPALGPWGVAALVAILLVTSLWFLRRRSQTV